MAEVLAEVLPCVAKGAPAVVGRCPRFGAAAGGAADRGPHGRRADPGRRVRGQLAALDRARREHLQDADPVQPALEARCATREGGSAAWQSAATRRAGRRYLTPKRASGASTDASTCASWWRRPRESSTGCAVGSTRRAQPLTPGRSRARRRATVDPTRGRGTALADSPPRGSHLISQARPARAAAAGSGADHLTFRNDCRSRKSQLIRSPLGIKERGRLGPATLSTCRGVTCHRPTPDPEPSRPRQQLAWRSGLAWTSSSRCRRANLGVVYFADPLAPMADDIVRALRERTGVGNGSGPAAAASSAAVGGVRQRLVVLVVELPDGEFRVQPSAPARRRRTTVCWLAHAELGDTGPPGPLAELAGHSAGMVVGALSRPGCSPVQIVGAVSRRGRACVGFGRGRCPCSRASPPPARPRGPPA